MKQLRSLVCTVVGHVDHGKTSLLDFIRGTSVVASEAGLITQCISCTNLKFEAIEKLCGKCKGFEKIKIPGLLFLDTPGHASFTNLRKRGGNLADIAVLVVDVNEGFKPQTIESVEILKQYKTPFVIAANKIDLINGWRSKEENILSNISKQNDKIRENLDKKIYEIVGKLSEFGFNSERFDRVDDYTKQIAIIPTSAKSGEGIAELLMVLGGLAQRFLEKNLEINVSKPAKGVILEVKEEKGLGTTLDVIIYDGILKKNDQIVIGGLNKAIVTKVRGLFEPSLKGKKLKSVEKVIAAIGVKILATDIGDVISGMPLVVANKNLEEAKKIVQEEVEEVLIETDKEGIIIKADSLGSLEALIKLLREKNIPIRKASIGEINKGDIMEAEAEENELNKVILGFNVKCILETKNVKLIINNIIYKVVEDYENWIEKEKLKTEEKKLKELTKPGKIEILHGTIFRQSNPAVFGVEILVGSLKRDVCLMKEDGKILKEVKSMQLDGENINEAKRGDKVAIAVQGIVVGRHVFEGEILYVNISEDDFRKLKEMKKLLNEEEIALLKEISIIKRKENPMWGV